MNGKGDALHNELTDPELALLLQEGDGLAFAALSGRYMLLLQKKASRYANVIGMDEDDFVQEGLLALFRAAQTYKPGMGAQFGTYANTCINNSMTDAIRPHLKHLQRSSFVCIEDLDQSALPGITEPSPVEDGYMDREHSHLRAQKIETLLSDFERQVLKLYLRGHTYEQISEILSTATKAVDNALQRVRRKLKPEI